MEDKIMGAKMYFPPLEKLLVGSLTIGIAINLWNKFKLVLKLRDIFEIKDDCPENKRIPELFVPLRIMDLIIP